MGGDVADAHVAVREQRDGAFCVGQRGQHVGVAGVVVAGEVRAALFSGARRQARTLVALQPGWDFRINLTIIRLSHGQSWCNG